MKPDTMTYTFVELSEINKPDLNILSFIYDQQ